LKLLFRSIILVSCVPPFEHPRPCSCVQPAVFRHTSDWRFSCCERVN
jgi:hypothetical protein